MTDIQLINSKFTIPTTLTAATILIAAFSDYNQLPIENHTITQYQIKEKVWEEQYVAEKFSINDFDKFKAIHQFAVDLAHDSENIPEKFAEVINEDFWDII
jgi:hypothetical protein